MDMSGKTTESLEMYLENILVLQNTLGRVRSIDIAHKTGYSKPSVSRAVKLLGNDGCINIDTDGFITLTEKGRQIADDILDRHRIISAFFESIGVSEETASEDACRIEHVISDETFEKLKRFIEDTKEKKD
jgi:Mn-dependent DtxR family transcriptional regulator